MGIGDSDNGSLIHTGVTTKTAGCDVDAHRGLADLGPLIGADSGKRESRNGLKGGAFSLRAKRCLHRSNR